MPSLSGTGLIHIIVQDVNDHSPQFQQQNYVVYIDENSPIGYSVTQLTATDSDIGLNAKIKYVFKIIIIIKLYLKFFNYYFLGTAFWEINKINLQWTKIREY